MFVALALIAMLIELCFGYPDTVLNVIGHPVTWIGRLIDALDDWLNRDAARANERRAAGVVGVLILVAVVGAVTLVVEYGLLRLPLGIFVLSFLASTLVAQRSLNRHVADVATALDKGESPLAASPSRGSSAATRQSLTPPALRARPSRASLKIFPTRSSRRSSGWS